MVVFFLFFFSSFISFLLKSNPPAIARLRVNDYYRSVRHFGFEWKSPEAVTAALGIVLINTKHGQMSSFTPAAPRLRSRTRLIHDGRAVTLRLMAIENLKTPTAIVVARSTSCCSVHRAGKRVSCQTTYPLPPLVTCIRRCVGHIVVKRALLFVFESVKPARKPLQWYRIRRALLKRTRQAFVDVHEFKKKSARLTTKIKIFKRYRDKCLPHDISYKSFPSRSPHPLRDRCFQTISVRTRQNTLAYKHIYMHADARINIGKKVTIVYCIFHKNNY